MTTDRSLIESDVEAYLARYQDKELLRFVAVGSVDDGKSTLIGRLLYDTGMVYEDHLAQIRKASTQEGMEIDLSLLTDGLTAEREQGITIDVAYRYFTTDKRKFIIADTPGHVQYTRNMVTGASTANVAIILIDARLGVLEQSRRHAYLASLLGIPHLAVCVNKMDLVAYDRARFLEIERDFRAFTGSLRFTGVSFFPISALAGVNCVHRGEETPWYEGPTVLEYLESVPVHADRNFTDFRFPVQYVLRPNLDYRGFAGQIASGVVSPGDRVRVLPSGKITSVRAIDFKHASLEEAFTPQSVVLRLADEVDVSRGDMIVHEASNTRVSRAIDAHLVWLHEAPLDRAKTYLLKHTTQTTRAEIDAITYRVDMQTLAEAQAETLALNDIARVRITTHKPLFCDPYTQNRATGSFVLIDAITNATVAAGMIHDVADADAKVKDTQKGTENITWHVGEVGRADRAALYGHEGALVWLTGLSGSGKSTLAHRVEKKLIERRVASYVLDGDNVRHGLCRDLGFSQGDRTENIRRAAEAAKLFVDAGLVVLAAFVSPYRADRERVRTSLDGRAFVEVHVATPLDVCAARDPKGLYAKSKDAKLDGLTGVSAPYEPPLSPELVIDTSDRDLDACAETLIRALVTRGIIPA